MAMLPNDTWQLLQKNMSTPTELSELEEYAKQLTFSWHWRKLCALNPALEAMTDEEIEERRQVYFLGWESSHEYEKTNKEIKEKEDG